MNCMKSQKGLRAFYPQQYIVNELYEKSEGPSGLLPTTAYSK